MKSDDVNMLVSAKRKRQRGIISAPCGMTVLLTLVVVTITLGLSKIIPSTIQHFIAAVLGTQLVAWAFSGRRDNR
jgi:hypothetical protein